MKRIASAKVNLSLRILGKRSDGFHELRSLMAPVSLADEVSLDLTEGRGEIAISSSAPDVPCDATNLAVIAARAFGNATGIEFQGSIHLEKNIPHGAGLGGGSSDAAAVICGLNAISGKNLSFESLEQIAAKVGSDVPFFIRGGAAWVSGRGETVEPTELPGKFHLVLIKPPFGVSTAWAYGRWGERNRAGALSADGVNFGGVEWVNDLEAPVGEKFLLIPALIGQLSSHRDVTVARMSGSGSTVFAGCRSSEESESLCLEMKELLGPTFQVFQVVTL